MANSFDYRSAWKRIRGYVSFQADPRNLSASQKRQIRIYDSGIADLMKRGVRVYRARNPRNLKAVQAYAQHPGNLKRLRVAFVPVADPSQPTRIRVNASGTVHVVSQGIARNVYLFADFEDYPGQRLSDMLTVIQRILSRDKSSRTFTRICGQHEESQSWPRNAELIANACQQYIENYGNHKRWFTGIIGYNFIAQADFSAYRKMRGLQERKKRNRRKRNPNRPEGK